MLRGRLLYNANASACLIGIGRNGTRSPLALAAAGQRGLAIQRPSHDAVSSPSQCVLMGSRSFVSTPVLSAKHSKHSKSPKVKSDKNRRKDSISKSSERHTPHLDTLLQLRDAITDNDVASALDAYLVVRSVMPIGGADVAEMAQTLHTAFRRNRPRSPQDKAPPELLAFADILVADIGAHQLPPNHTAHLHLLAYYKEAGELDKGVGFWEWLENQDDSYVDPAVYGAAIELLAVQGRPGEEIELLFEQALKRFPGAYNEYHLSPHAIVADRSRPINIKGIPTTLLQGILHARLLRGDTKGAYMALDTGLRLFPTQLPSRFFNLFVSERPIAEGYKVFLMACRSGTTLGPDCLKSLLQKMRHTVVADPLANASVLRSMLTAAYAYAASGSSLSTDHLNECVIAITSVFQDHTARGLSGDQANSLSNAILQSVSKLFAIWRTQGARPGIAAFNTVLANVAGKGQTEAIIATCLADMEALELEPTHVTRRCIMKAAGEGKQSHILRSTWQIVVDSRPSHDRVPKTHDWQSLAKAAVRTGDEEFVRQQLDSWSSDLDSFVVTRIERVLDSGARETANHVDSSVIPDQLTRLIEKIDQDADYVEHQLRNDRFLDFRANPLPMTLGSAEAAEGVDSEKELRALYDELTTDKSYEQARLQQSKDTMMEATEGTPIIEAAGLVEPAMSSTEFDYAELRYQNWKTLNELLAEAEQRDDDFLRAVDTAIEQGTPPPQRNDEWKNPSPAGPSVGLTDYHATKAGSNGTVHGDSQNRDIRQEVLRLRAYA